MRLNHVSKTMHILEDQMPFLARGCNSMVHVHVQTLFWREWLGLSATPTLTQTQTQ